MEGLSVTVLRKREVSPELAGACEVVDVTSKGPHPWHRLSPFFPHGNIPIPMWPGRVARSVEGIWQGLKRFENEDCVDEDYFDGRAGAPKRKSDGRARHAERRGRVLGHQAGANAGILLGYVEARRLIYVPSYEWVLERAAREEVEQLVSLASRRPLILLDHHVNGDVEDVSEPLSHAALIAAALRRSLSS